MTKETIKKVRKGAAVVLLLFLSIYLSGCSCNGSKAGKKYYIGIDPSFYPLELELNKKNVYGYSQEILLEMAEELNIRFFVVKANYNSLFNGLEMNTYEAVMSSKYPHSFSTDKYNFSDVFLETGYCLIVKEGMKYSSLSDMNNKLVGYIRGDKSVLLLEKNPSIIVKIYDSTAALLEDVNSGFLDGAILDKIKGTSFVNNLFNGRLKVLPPLTDDGIRVISLKNDKEIVDVFNKGLANLKKKGRVAILQKKWGLN